MTDNLAYAAAPRRSIEFDLRLRRAIVRAERTDTLIQDRIDCAELALAAGLHNEAAALYGVIFLELGFSPTRIELQRELWTRTGWWGNKLPPSEPMPVQGLSVDLAISELQSLLSYGLEFPNEPQPSQSWLPADTFGLPPLAQASENDTAELATRILPTLIALPDAMENQLAPLLRELADESIPAAIPRVADHLDRSLGELASILALAHVRAFLISNEDLLIRINATPALIGRAASLHPNALGPYFSNVSMLLRDVRDIFVLIEAARNGKPSLAEQECWAVLLSAHLSEGMTAELVDELGDRGMDRALRMLLIRVARSAGPRPSPDIVWRIRDAAIDIGSKALAEEAQKLVVLWRPKDSNECKILGEIRAWRGDIEGASLAFDRGLTLSPGDGDLTTLQASLAAGNPVYLNRGFSTSEGRLRLRHARLKSYRAAS